MPLSSLPAPGAHGLSLALLQALWSGGVREFVLAPGSRSAPLALALHRADAVGDVRLHVRVDERSAGFLALGLAKGSRRPVAVVTTSGTAVGNLLPAVMEAHHTGVPLVVVSADRPERLRGTGANQTTLQAGIFGPFAACHDLRSSDSPEALAAAAGSACVAAGPTQLNLQLDGDLMPSEADPATWWSRPAAAPAPHPASSVQNLPARIPSQPVELTTGPRTVVVAGDDAGPAACLLAEAGNWPLLAEPTSGARVGRQAIRAYRLLLGGPLRAEIDRVIVIGHPTLSRPVTSLISDPTLEVLAVRDRSGTATDPGRVARVLDAVPTLADSPTPSSVQNGSDWFDRWRAADDALSARIDAYIAQRPGSPLALAAVVADAVTPHTSLVLGSSNVIRDLDVMATPWTPHEHRFVVGNRGLAGIDGTVSTAVGIALGRPGASRTIAYLGDLTFLHDTNGLLIGPDEPRPDITFVVLNDDGGAIFAGLEQGGTPYESAFERVFGTPHGTDLAALCRAHGIEHETITEPERLATALRSEPSGIRLIEVPVSRADRRAEAERLRELARPE
ncbi:2-succinyl-5-enolpyruvyl-6-hydroxy-3-cyclohexene-1-carboxylic-acid synthase [Intrasporangium calvum]|uniref:2-succinyl-5-enolpyruvyl-6-hydroxy-3-cyclohexene-1-carboxylate synthase n=1 Tax=Intrasporangium calvum (strain ATCC 23552 / DSM 43043 / JCM 3097 / NBRC 12989 / NCIMB 10167 / NRRL B-3866 / 7 KIP) TaxID=710696 RepID=E6SAH7_INTC7|nr:2-succinyl-5-enolpyruvyl-6-hydroxy-3-cyclohexene-1-carboxylic-acid synthase [Intrasporangium calvum]ADU47227.1 2-succinyl-6-hydroxy-2,4-cyclohexadiene-1- carboxylic acid synthase/2-oxoglutarate decarboxylase [Intrasporangium calvum DSM 43043]